MKIGFLVWSINKKTRLKRCKVVYKWQDLQKIDKCPYTKQDYNYVKLLEQADGLDKAIEKFRAKFPVRIPLTDFLREASSFCKENVCLPFRDGWRLVEGLIPPNQRFNASFLIASLCVQYKFSPIIREQLENILFYGFVDERICKNRAPIQICIPHPDEEEFYTTEGRAPIEIYLRDGNITKKELFEEITKQWKDIKHYFQDYPNPKEMPVSDKELNILSARNKGKSYGDILDENDSEDMPVEEYDKASLENYREILYRTKKKQRKIIKSP